MGSITLSPTPYELIVPMFMAFKKKMGARYEDPRNNSEIVGIYHEGALSGYFILFGYDDGDLEVNQAYLDPSVQHGGNFRLAVTLLEQKAKRAGFKRVMCGADRNLKGYTRFMHKMGYKPERIIFSKEVNI